MTLNNSYLYFHQPLEQTDPIVSRMITKELWRQQDHIELIASENIVSKAVLQAARSGVPINPVQPPALPRQPLFFRQVSAAPLRVPMKAPRFAAAPLCHRAMRAT